ncbi:MAG: methylated-DNA--[protein]-cysteine S-methyltransferase [Pseudomonadota bacterium]
MFRKSIDTPLGRLVVREANKRVVAVSWDAADHHDDTPVLREATRQLTAYFAGTLISFDLPLQPDGDEFQQSVCAAMLQIPFGQTREYGEIARDLGSMPQPVGNACGRNSIPVIIPCHRVVGATGLGGFSAPGGVETKVALLKHEGAYGLLL